MKIYRKLKALIKNQEGAIALMVALLLPVLFGAAAMAVDIGLAAAAKNELQNIADATALAGAEQIGYDYRALSFAEQKSYVCDASKIVSVINDVASKNQAGGKSVAINAADVVIGRWDSSTNTLLPTLEQPDAVGIKARSNMSTLFAKVFGTQSVSLDAGATAALTSVSKVGTGEIDLPVGISKKWFESGGCQERDIKFYPTGSLDGCAGWHTFDNAPANACTLKNILKGMASDPPSFVSPETVAGQTQYVFSGGNLASAFKYMKQLYDAKKDPATGEWETTIAVYDKSSCCNPNGWQTISGFATAVITGVDSAPTKTIRARVICESITSGRGGGGDFGSKGSIASLVE